MRTENPFMLAKHRELMHGWGVPLASLPTARV
jgi:hypothetical protein